MTAATVHTARAAGSQQHVDLPVPFIGPQPAAHPRTCSLPRVTTRGLLRRRSAMKRCAQTQPGAGWAGRRFLPSGTSDGMTPGPAQCSSRGDFLCPSACLPQPDIRQAAQSLGARWDLILLASPVVDPLQPARIDAHLQPAFFLQLVRLFRAHRPLRYGRHVRKSMAHLIKRQSIPNGLHVSAVTIVLTACPYKRTVSASTTQVPT
jgi:hypothetical protein